MLFIYNDTSGSCSPGRASAGGLNYFLFLSAALRAAGLVTTDPQRATVFYHPACLINVYFETRLPNWKSSGAVAAQATAVQRRVLAEIATYQHRPHLLNGLRCALQSGQDGLTSHMRKTFPLLWGEGAQMSNPHPLHHQSLTSKPLTPSRESRAARHLNGLSHLTRKARGGSPTFAPRRSGPSTTPAPSTSGTASRSSKKRCSHETLLSLSAHQAVRTPTFHSHRRRPHIGLSGSCLWGPPSSEPLARRRSTRAHGRSARCAAPQAKTQMNQSSAMHWRGLEEGAPARGGG